VLTGSPIAAILITCAAWFALFVVGVGNELVADFKKREEQSARDTSPPAAWALLGQMAAPGAPGPLLATTTLNPKVAERLDPPRYSQNWLARAVVAVHYVLPRTRNLDELTTLLLLRDLLFDNRVGTQKLNPAPISWTESLIASGAWLTVMLGLACWRFATKDY
jgi:hypothetical protein